MIKFNCRICGKEFTVDESKIGMRGKCPKCSSIIIVPATSNDQLVLLEDTQFFEDSELNDLYEHFLQSQEGIIHNHQILNEHSETVAKLEIITDIGRSQLIFISSFLDEHGETWVGVFSNIGEITEKDSAILALRNVDKFAPYCLSLEDDNRLLLTAAHRVSNLDNTTFEQMLMMIAHKADSLEEGIFGIDRF